jgi:hypothetical protein
LVDEGLYISDDFLTIIFDGTVHPADKEDSALTRNYSKMPYFDPEGK